MSVCSPDVPRDQLLDQLRVDTLHSDGTSYCTNRWRVVLLAFATPMRLSALRSKGSLRTLNLAPLHRWRLQCRHSFCVYLRPLLA
jgi:hypothetical protein